MLTFEQVKVNPLIKSYIAQTSETTKKLGYTDHGLRHSQIVSDRAGWLAEQLKLPKRAQELAQIAGYCHDMGNFVGRTQHHYWGSLLFSQVFHQLMTDQPDELVTIMQAIVGHDKDQPYIQNKVAAIVILADKSDVSRSRVTEKNMINIRADIHDRVNYAVTNSQLLIKGKLITLKLIIDTKFTPVMEYFEIFTDRMVFCRQAAIFLGYQFGLKINDFKLL